MPEKNSSQKPFTLIFLLGFFILSLQFSHLLKPAKQEPQTLYNDEQLLQATKQHPHLLFQAIAINAASPQQLAVVPGIGPELSRRIVAYRNEHGPFHSLEGLRQVNGIGPRKLESLKAYCRL